VQYIVPAENQIAEVVELIYAIKRGSKISTEVSFGGEVGPLPQQVHLVVLGKFQIETIFINKIPLKFNVMFVFDKFKCSIHYIMDKDCN